MIQFRSPDPVDTERLGDEIARLAAHLHAATYRMLVLIREFDAREGWGGGFRSCAHWLSWRTGIGPGAAREKVRVAKTLASLPRISGAMESGELSFSKVRAMTRVATPENEGELLELARHATAAHIEKIVRAWRRVGRLEDANFEAERHLRRFLDLHPDDDGSWVIRGRLDPEVGAVLGRALAWASDQLYRDAPEVERRETTVGQRRADAMAVLAEEAMATRSAGDADIPPAEDRSGPSTARVAASPTMEASATGASGSGAEHRRWEPPRPGPRGGGAGIAIRSSFTWDPGRSGPRPRSPPRPPSTFPRKRPGGSRAMRESSS